MPTTFDLAILYCYCFHPAILFLKIHPEANLLYVQNDVLTATLIAKYWKPKCPQIGDWANRLAYSYKGIYTLLLKKRMRWFNIYCYRIIFMIHFKAKCNKSDNITFYGKEKEIHILFLANKRRERNEWLGYRDKRQLLFIKHPFLHF